MQPDERALLLAVACKPEGVFVRDVIQGLRPQGLSAKRAWYLLSKWLRKEWYIYGVSLDTGWLTEEGRAQAERVRNEADAAA